MGFFDFVGKAIHTLENVVTKSPIAGTLQTVAKMVVNAIPVVGPILDSVIPAAQAIFSNDSPSSAAAASGNPDSQPVLINLDRKTDEILSDLAAVKTGINEVERSIKDLQENLKSTDQTIKLETERILGQLNVFRFLDHKGKINIAITWMEDQTQNLLKDASADNSGKLMSLLGKADPGSNIITVNQDLRKDLQLIWGDLSIQWLLMYDKAVIVVKGFLAKNQASFGEWGAYLQSLTDLDASIVQLRLDARREIKNLNELLQRFVDEKGHYSSRTSSIKLVANPDNANQFSIVDEWPELGLGGVKSREFKAQSGVKDNLEMTEADYKSSPGWILYKEVAAQALDFHLRPMKATIEFLTTSLPEWNSRIPVSPVTTVTNGYIAGPNNTTLPNIVKVDHLIAELQTTSIDGEGPGEYGGFGIRYAVTYSSTTGESPPSEYSAMANVTANHKAVKLAVSPVQFEHDSMKGLSNTINGKPALMHSGIRRRIYVRYYNGTTPKVNFLGVLEAGVNNYTHDLTKNTLQPIMQTED